MRRVLRVGRWFALLVAVITAALAAAGWWALRRSLPRTSGAVAVAALGGPVRIERDALGVPTIRGDSLEDVACGQGFVHGQDRFFQMDLSRRVTAGDLAALLGAAALPLDVAARPLGFRALAADLLKAMPERHRRVVRAYAEGVNAGLADLGGRPPEYLLLRAAPRPWTEQDTVLLLYFLVHRLSINHVLEAPAGVMRDTLPAALFEFLTPDVSRFDSPLIEADGPTPPLPLPLPGPDVVDLRGRGPWSPPRRVVRPIGTSVPGSNNWVVAGTRTAHGGAILAGDPHLTLSMPNVWYRVQLDWGDRTLLGVGPPGVPGVIMGTNDHLAWAATNSIVDRVDLVVVAPDADDAGRYRTPDGSEPFARVVERIPVRGGADHELEVRRTRWGPVVGADRRGRPLALRAAFLDPGGAGLGIFDLYATRDLDAGLDVLRRWRGPSLNWLLASRDGRIGWIVGGAIPERVGFDGRTPGSWATGSRRWAGPIDESARPALVDPPTGVLYTANHRTVPVDDARRLGRAWMLPARAHRIAECLAAEAPFDERDLHRLQHDVRSTPMDLIAELALEVTADTDDADLRRVRAHVAAWDGLAAAESPGFRILHAYYGRLTEAVLAPLLRPCVEADPEFVYNWPMADEPFRRIVESRPAHLLPPGHADWTALLRDELARTVETLRADPRTGGGLDATWGDVNRLAIRHPVSRVAPLLGAVLDLPADPVPGWRATVRMETPSYGATMRMVVAPGHLDDALFTMPGGQSGHFLSPHYDDGHAAWVQGRPRPLRPGPAASAFTLRPAG